MKKTKSFIAIVLLSSFLLSSCSSGLSNIESDLSNSETKISSSNSLVLAPEEVMSRLNKSIDFATNTKSTNNNKNLKLLIDGPQAYPALEEMILSAKKSVYVEVFGFKNDPTGKKIADAMVKKAKEGVDVKFIYDFIANKDVTLIQYMGKNGVDVKTYGKKDLGINARITHRKIYIVDGMTAMTGGMNIDTNFASDGLFHDILMSYEGQAVKETINEFFNDWELSGGKVTPSMQQVYDDQVIIKEDEKTYNLRLVVTNPIKTKRLEKKEDIYKMFLTALDSAKYNVKMALPYFTDDTFIKHIIYAKNRGVKVSVLIPNKTNIELVTMANKMTINQLVTAGVDVYLGGKVDGSFNHSKLMTIDDVWTTIGSCNADARAFHKNQELNIAVSDIDFTKEVNTRFFDRFIGEATKAEYENIAWYKKPAYALVEKLDFFL